MTFYLVMNGAGRRPHVEEVDTLEDVQSRLEAEDDPNDIVVIEGEMIDHKKEEFLFLADQTIALSPPKAESKPKPQGELPEWMRPEESEEVADGDAEETSAVAREAEHRPDVERHPRRQADETSGDEPGEGPDEGGDGADSGGGDDVEG